MNNRTEQEIAKYDYLYEKYPVEYGQIDKDEPRFVESLNILKSITGARTVLDAGVGRGGFYSLIKNEYDCHGIEPSKIAVEKFHCGDDRVRNLAVEQLPHSFAANSFDVVTCLDVLEHIPSEELDKAFESLSAVAKRYLIFSIANHQDVWDGLDLHVSIFSFSEWEEKLRSRFNIVLKIYTHEKQACVYLVEKKAREVGDGLVFIANGYAKAKPLVSVVVPTYNQAEFLGKALDSILAQTYARWEAIVVNDGSTDRTREVIERYERMDDRIRGVHKENGGISSALNEGIAHATGDYFCWLSSDDLFNPNKLDLQVSAFRNLDERYAIAFGGFDLIDANDTPTVLEQKKPFVDGMEFPQCLKYDYIDGCTIMIPMKVMRETHGFNTNFKHAQDTELWFRLAAKGYRFHYIDDKLTRRRIHPHQGFTDFELDCRFDGFWMVDFYIGRYSFRDFYKNIDFTDHESLKTFIVHLLDMLSDPNCHINHPILREKFWSWLLTGVATLDAAVQRKIMEAGVLGFAELERNGEFFREYQKRFVRARKNIKPGKPKRFTVKTTFEDITKFDKARDNSFVSRQFEFAVAMEREGNLKVAQNAYKYLADTNSTLAQRAYQKFFEMTFLRRKYDAFLKSFKRKPNIDALPDATKAHIAWSHRMVGSSGEQVEAMAAMIRDENLRKRVQEWNRRQSFPDLPNNAIIKWNYSVVPYSIHHQLDLECPTCKRRVSLNIEFDIAVSASRAEILCPQCFAAYTISDEHLANHFLSRIPPATGKNGKNRQRPTVAVVMRYSNIIGGGVKMMLKHAEWLSSLGCNVTIYSDAPPPSWTTLTSKFVQVKDHYDIKETDFDLVIVFSIYDVPKMLTKFPAEKIVHFCQGYEGYHIGRTYDELRSDKHFYTLLHSLPVKNAVISTHLMSLFSDKFGRTSHYLPNGVNHSVFYPDPTVAKDPRSLLFIGNPNDPLKGLIYLIRTLEELQKSQFKIDGLVLHVVWGGAKRAEEDKVIPMAGYIAKYHEGLSSREIAALMNRVELVVNTSWYEGFSLPVLEAMACGTPVVTTNNMGAESFCRDGENGFVVRYGDMTRLGNIILDVLRKRVNLDAMTRNGLETAREFSEAGSVRHFVKAYSQVLNTIFPEDRVRQLLASVGGESKEVPVQPNSKISFSVLVPTYNQANYLPAALDSLFAQSYPDWEAIVVNDGSTDDTREVMERYAAKDARIRPFHRENGGVASALNEALRHATGEWICWLSSDDLFESNKLAIHVQEIGKHPETKFFHTHYFLLNDRTGERHATQPDLSTFMPKTDDMVLSFFYSNYINGISVCIHRSVIDQAGPFNGSLSNGQDFDMWLRISARCPSRFIDHRTCITRVHAEQGTIVTPEAGIFDSARSCLEFLNGHTFAELFPHTNLSEKEHIYTAIQKTLAVVSDPKSFVNRLGYGGALLERLKEWVGRSLPPALRAEIVPQLFAVAREAQQSDLPVEIKEAYRRLPNVRPEAFRYVAYEPFETAFRHAEALEARGENNQALSIKNYLAKRGFVPQVPAANVGELLSAVYHCCSLKRFDDALTILNDLERIVQNESHGSDASKEEFFNLSGAVYLALKRLEEAKECFEKALSANPQSSEACMGLGEVFYLAEMDEHAKTMLEWAVKHDPTNESARTRLATVNQHLGLAGRHSTLEPNVLVTAGS